MDNPLVYSVPARRAHSVRYLLLMVGALCFALGWIAAQFIR
jgi:hypothetical protein